MWCSLYGFLTVGAIAPVARRSLRLWIGWMVGRTWLQLPILQRTHGRSTLHARTVGGLGSCMQRSAVTGALSTAEMRCLHSTVRVCWPRSQLVEQSLHSVASHLHRTNALYA